MVVRGEFGSAVNMSLELVAVFDLLLGADVLRPAADHDGVPLVTLARVAVEVDRSLFNRVRCFEILATNYFTLPCSMSLMIHE